MNKEITVGMMAVVAGVYLSVGAAGKSVWAGEINAAAEAGDLKRAEQLLAEKPALVMARDRYGLTPMHDAVACGQAGMVKLFLARGGDIRSVDNRGWTLLHHAVANGHQAIVELLLAKGADINAGNLMGWTPLHQAVLASHTAIVQLLLQKGADPYARNKKGATAYDVAKEYRRDRIGDLLVSVMVETKAAQVTPPRRDHADGERSLGGYGVDEVAGCSPEEEL